MQPRTGANSDKVKSDFAAVQKKIRDDHKLTSKSIEKQEDWREMSDREWGKLLEDVDKYIDEYKAEMERQKELQDEAMTKSALNAEVDSKANAAMSAALSVAANGVAGAGQNAATDEETLEKSSWTYELESEDQEVLARAKAANNLKPSFPYGKLALGSIIEYNSDAFVGNEKENLEE